MLLPRLLPVCAALLIATAGCSSSPSSPSSPDLHTTVTLAPGESAPIGGRTSVAFQSVVSDSRCPADVMCVQAGDATITVLVTSGSAEVELQLKTSEAGRSADAGGFTLTLDALTPYPYSGRPTAPQDYRATIEVSTAGH